VEDVVVYTDGACSGNPGPGGWAALVAERSSKRFWDLGGAEQSTTNNLMEMTAVQQALHFVLSKCSPGALVGVYTDSSYVLKGASEWIFGWKRRGWIKADGAPVANKDHWIALDEVVQQLGSRLKWHLVPGHSGVPGNERVDKISVEYSMGRVPTLRTGDVSELGFDPWAPVVLRADLGAKLAKPLYLSLVNGQLEKHATWTLCEARVRGARGAKFKKIERHGEEASILEQWGVRNLFNNEDGQKK
jgi:ribonuclease HI